MKKGKNDEVVIVYYFMNGCPHCEANRKAWKEAKQMAKDKGIETEEIESQDPRCDESSFPTIVLKKDGKKTNKRVEGSRKSGGEIMKGLGLQSGGRRRRSTRRGRINSRRRFRDHSRTLRNNVAFR